MKTIGVVLFALAVCVGFVIFFTAFLVLPFLLLGVFVLFVTLRDRRRMSGKPPKPPRRTRRFRRRSVTEGGA